MIPTNLYTCGGSSLFKATLACIHSGCTNFAFMCENEGCTCRAAHPDHNFIFFTTLIRKFSKPESPVKITAQSDMELNVVIDGLIRQWEDMRNRHNEYIKEYTKSQLGRSPLREKLFRQKHVDRAEATGDKHSIVAGQTGQTTEID